MTALQVMAEWCEFDSTLGRFESTGEPVQLPHRETARMLYVTFPSGWVKGVRKYRKRHPHGVNNSYREFFGRPGETQGFKLTWDPTLYEIKEKADDKES